MAIEEETFYNVIGEEINRSNILNQMIGFYSLMLEVGQTKVTDFNEGSEIRNLLESVAVLGYYVMEDQNELSKIAFPDTAEGEWLDKHGANPFIKIERDMGTEATGYVVFSISDAQTEDIIIPQETIVVSTESSLEYATDSEVIIPVGETEVTASVTCLTEGLDGNCSENTVTMIDDDYLDISELSVNNPEAFSGGTNYEEDDEYRKRILAFVRQSDFGSLPYYQELGNSIDGVHDVLLVDTGETNDIGRPYTKEVLVNGDTKPVSEDLLLSVLEVFSDTNKKVIDHTFLVGSPDYVEVSLTVNLSVDNELADSDVAAVVQAVFDGGCPVDSMEFDGLCIGETLFKNSIVSALEIFDSVKSVTIIDDDTQEELTDLSVDSDEVLQLVQVTVNQTIIS